MFLVYHKNHYQWTSLAGPHYFLAVQSDFELSILLHCQWIQIQTRAVWQQHTYDAQPELKNMHGYFEMPALTVLHRCLVW